MKHVLHLGTLASFAAIFLSILMPTPALAQVGPGYALSFNGIDQYISATIPTLSSNYTVSTWAFLRSGGSQTGGRVGLLTGSTCGGSAEMLVRSTNSSSSGPQFLELARCGAFTRPCSTNPVPTNEWVHLAMTVSSSKVISYFINGVPSGSWTATNEDLAIGPSIHVADNLATRHFDGLLDEFEIWSRALSQTEIQTNMYGTLTGAEPDLVAYWPFSEGGRVGTTGARTADASRHGCTGTLVNRPSWCLSAVPKPLGLRLLGPNPLSHECHTTFTEPGAGLWDTLPSIADDSSHSVALKADGTVIAWGSNANGETNVPASATNVVAIQSTMALKADGTVIAWGSNNNGQTNVPASATNIVALASCLALKADGAVIAWGYNGSGQTNVPASATNVVAIATGGSHSIALKADGTVIAWGDNSYGLTNVPASATNVVAIAAGGFHSLALKADGTVTAWGNYATNVPASATNVVAIAAGGYHSIALKADGTVTAWGDNGYGQTNVPASATNVVAIAAGGNHCMALQADGTVIAWGRTSFGQSSVPADVNFLNTPVTITGAVNTNSPGTNVLTYTATKDGFTATNSRTVVVADTTPPVITLNGANPMAFTNANRIFVDPGATAQDACGGSQPIVTTQNNVNPNYPGTYTVTYTSTDNYGNAATNTRTVHVALPAVVAGDLNGDGTVDRNEINTALTNYFAANAAPWLQITNQLGLGGSNVTFALADDTNALFNVECSTNLTNWDLLGPASPRYEFIDTNAPAVPQRFYRLRWP